MFARVQRPMTTFSTDPFRRVVPSFLSSNTWMLTIDLSALQAASATWKPIVMHPEDA